MPLPRSELKRKTNEKMRMDHANKVELNGLKQIVLERNAEIAELQVPVLPLSSCCSFLFLRPITAPYRLGAASALKGVL